jgi:transcriptional/translational regulatory protein YebC/TACO1
MPVPCPPPKSRMQPAESGSVLFNFQRVGQIVVQRVPSEDAMFEAAMEASCDDFVPMLDDEGEPTTSYKVSPRPLEL